MSELNQKTCIPCSSGVPPLGAKEFEPLLKQLNNWQVVDNHHLFKEFKLANFVSALDLVNKIGEIAEEQGHHPNLFLTWGQVKVEIYTHKINGLSEGDFILAAKIDCIG